MQRRGAFSMGWRCWRPATFLRLEAATTGRIWKKEQLFGMEKWRLARGVRGNRNADGTKLRYNTGIWGCWRGGGCKKKGCLGTPATKKAVSDTLCEAVSLVEYVPERLLEFGSD